ncbi:MAG: hypothetical protein AABX13_01245 [Nanoarchaeota archaeon]|mgnify:FL=1
MTAATLLILFLLGLALAYLLWKFLFAPERSLSLPLPEEQTEEKRWYYPYPSPPGVKRRIQRQQAEHKDKAKHQKMETILASWGLAPTKVLLPENFRKLVLVVQEQRKRRFLSPSQQKALERLEQLLGEKKEGPVYLPFTKRETKDVFTLLRRMSRGK